jgi:hypothetical protein
VRQESDPGFLENLAQLATDEERQNVIVSRRRLLCDTSEGLSAVVARHMAAAEAAMASELGKSLFVGEGTGKP